MVPEDLMELARIADENAATKDARIAALEAQLAERAKTAAMLSNLLAVIHRDGGHYEAEHGTEKACADAEATVVRLLATPPAPKVTECATEGCEQTATVRFERGGVGSDYCHDCHMRIQAITAAQEAGKQ